MKAKFMMLGLLVLPSLAFAVGGGANLGVAAIAEFLNSERAQTSADHASMRERSENIRTSSAPFKILGTKSIQASSGDSCEAVPQTALSVDPISLKDCTREMSEATPGAYCECINGTLSRMSSSDKRNVEAKAKVAKEKLQVEATKLIAKAWFDKYRRIILNSQSVASITGNKSQALGFTCSPEIIQDQIKKFADGLGSSCDGSQRQIMERMINSAQGRGISKQLANAERMKPVHEDGVYSCVGRSGIDLVSMMMGENGFNYHADISGSVVSASRARSVARMKSVTEQVEILKAKKDDFLRDPKQFDLNQSSESLALKRAIDSLPLASDLIRLYTRSEIFDVATSKRRALSRAEKLENRDKLIKLLERVSKFYQNVGRVTPDQLEARNDIPKIRFAEMKKIFSEEKKFNEYLEEQLKELNATRANGSSAMADHSVSLCADLTRDISLLACTPPPVSQAAFGSLVLGQPNLSAPLLSDEECNKAKNNVQNSGEILAACFENNVGACQLNQGADLLKDMHVVSDLKRLGAEGLEQQATIIEDSRVIQSEFCNDYTEWVDTKACKGLAEGSQDLQNCLEGNGSPEKFAASNPDSPLAQLLAAQKGWGSPHSRPVVAGREAAQQMEAAVVATNVANRTALERLIPSDLLSGAFSVNGNSESSSSTLVTSTFMSDLGMAARDLAPMVGAQAQVAVVAPQVTLPYAATAQSLKRAVAQKDEEIQTKEEEIVQRQTQFQAPSTPPAEKSALAAQIAALEAELKRLREDREDLEKQQRIAATEAEVQNSGNASRAPASTRTARAASTKADAPEVQSSGFSIGGGSSGGSGGGTGGAQASQAAASANFGTGASFGGKLGASSGAGLGSLSTAVRENLTLTVGGQPLSSANVVSLEVASTKDPAVIEQAISAQKDKLKFNAEGWATVEVYDQATKTAVYYQVRLNDSKLVLQMISKDEQQGIQKQVREWTASYQNLLKRLQRAPAQVSN